MVFKRFRLNILIRILFLAAALFLFFYLLQHSGLWMVKFTLLMIIIWQIYLLVQYVEKSMRNLNRFLEAVRYSDFSSSFTGTGLGASFAELNETFAAVIQKFQEARAEKEENFRYLQTVVQHVGIGLLAFRPDGEVELMNTAVKRLLRIRQLKNITLLGTQSAELVKKLFTMKSGSRTIIKIQEENELLQLAVYATEFKMRGKQIKLVSLQNIQSELEEQELEAWQKLIRVLTHEIMNSVTPIASLASTANEMLLEDDDDFRGEKSADVRSAIATIEKRSKGLLQFVNSYRSLTRLPKPDFQIIPVVELFGHICRLMKSELTDKKIHFHSHVNPSGLQLTADPAQIEQVLINLLKNAIDGLDSRPDPRIELKAAQDERGRVVIQVTDNGQGITKEAQDKIFIPFFTTKKSGTGIGLSLSRQIMRLHHGTISVYSEENVKTVFKLIF
ncbi:MAG: ATP-binding protein [Calditrichia bacterium]